MSKLKLTDVEWGVFKLKEIFEVENCKCSKVSGLSLGDVPYVGATNRNNGNLMYLEYQEKLITKGNCLVFICDGEGSIGYSFYKGEDFIGTTTVKAGRNERLNKYNGMFISTVADTVRGKYNFGYKRNEFHLKNETLQLPIDSNGQPNWQFMEDYVKQEQKIQAQKIVDYYEQKLIDLVADVIGLDKVEWKSFRFTDIFQKIQRGKRLTKANQMEGQQPYVSSTAENNGVDDFINNNKGVRKFENVLTLANSGSVGSTFYQYFEFVASDHVTALKAENADKYAYLFLASIVKRLEEKYSFNREINDTRIKRERILLPTDEFGNPNWKYMSDFVKKMELDKVHEVLEYIYIYIYIYIYQTEDNA